VLQILRVVAIALFTIVAGSAGYAFAASNSGLAGPGGDGAGAISGYSVENVSYSLNSLDPTRIDAVSFDLDADGGVPRTLKVKLVSDSDTWHSCSVSTDAMPARATCALGSSVAVVDVDEVRVVAAQ
jgi:hypothetical protein